MSCTKEFLPFSDTSDEELMQTTIGKQIKFTHIDKVPKSVKENFFTMSELQSLTYNKKVALHCPT